MTIIKLDGPDDMLPEYDLDKMRIVKRGPGHAQKKELKQMTTTAVLTIESILNSVNQLPDTDQREVAISLLQRFDGNTILDILSRLRPVEPDYEDPGPLTDEESIFAAEQAFLEYDRQEAANA